MAHSQRTSDYFFGEVTAETPGNPHLERCIVTTSDGSNIRVGRPLPVADAMPKVASAIINRITSSSSTRDVKEVLAHDIP